MNQKLKSLFILLLGLPAQASYLTQTQIDQYNRDAFLIIKNFVEPSQCDDLQKSASRIVEGFEPGEKVHIFSTEDNNRASQDQYFLESSDNISFFFEKDAFDANGQLKRAKDFSINKIGHALHELDPTFKEFSFNPKLSEIAKDLGVIRPQLIQSMYIFKQPFIGGEVSWHQDGAFLYTSKENTLGFWFALEDANEENSCLWAIPGGHKNGLRDKFTRTPDGKGTQMTSLNQPPFETDKKIPLPVPKGTLIILHSRVPHMSETNQSPISRHAYTLHVIDGESEYPADNWLQRKTPPPDL